MSGKMTKNKIIRTISITILCVLLGLVVALEYKAVVKNAETEKKNEQDLQLQITELTKNVKALETEKEELQEKITEYEKKNLDAELKSVLEENEKLLTLAGMTEKSGEGVKIILDYDEKTDISNTQSLILQLINELRAAEATAISINGERLVATSEVKALDKYLVINGSVFYGPFEIIALGDSNKLDGSLRMSGIITQFENFFIVNNGKLIMSTEKQLKVSAIDTKE